LLNSCGHCYGGRHDEQNVCDHSSDVDMSQMDIMGMGGLAEYINADLSQVYFLNNDLPVEKACFAEPLACVLNSIEKGKIEIGDDVVVIGGGIMGQLHVMCSKLQGARVIMSEPDEARRKLAAELGADVCIDPTACDAVETVKELTDGNGAAVVFNTTAVSAVAQQAIGMVAKMGRVIMYSSQHPDKPIEVSPNWLHNSEAVITGAVSPSLRSFRRSCDALYKGIIDPEKLVSGVFDIDDAQKAFETAIRPDTFRCIIKM
jgi:L-iditol 2-dehydrogenase